MKKKRRKQQFPLRELKKLFCIMKLVFFFLLLSSNFVWAGQTYAQITSLNLDLTDVELEEVFDAIRRQSEFEFFYNNDQVNTSVKVSVKAKNADIQTVLKQALPAIYEYKINDRYILINKRKEVTPVVTPQPQQTKKTITGKITDKNGESIIGANIIEKGTLSNGTVTDANGNFSLRVENDAVLHISYIGYLSQDINTMGRTSVDVILQEDTKALDELIVIGYGIVKKSDLTGSVSTIKADDLRSIPSNSIERLLQGRSPGLQVVNSSQDPGAGATVRIRGGSSIRGSNTPLLVVDGFPIGDASNLKQINPNDIASIEVLKDASASAIYGSRGANGVIMVTTKKARIGVSQIEVDHHTTLSRFSSNLFQYEDPILLMQLHSEGRVNSGQPPLYVGAVAPNGVYYPSQQEVESGQWPHFTDWTDIVFRDTPLLTNTSISFSNANERTSVKLGGNYFTQQGTYVKDRYSKLIGNLNLSHKFSDKLTINSLVNVMSDHRIVNGGLTHTRNPLWPVYDEDDNYFLVGNQDFAHPVALTEHRKDENRTFDVLASVFADWQVAEPLTLKAQLSYKRANVTVDQYYPKDYTATGFANNGAANMNTRFAQNLAADAYLTYNKMFAQKHDLTLMSGYSIQDFLNRGFNMSSYGFVSETLQNENMGMGDPTLNRHSNDYSAHMLLSGLFRVNYTFDDRFLFTITSRADGSTKFGDNNKWAFFPSGAAAWKLHNESFMDGVDFFDELKIRASYGISGNQGISPYQTLSRYGQDYYFADSRWETTIGPGRVIGRTGSDYRYTQWGGIPNKGLRWETTRQSDVGLDAVALQGRLSFTFDYYRKHTLDLLRESFLPLSSGFDKMWINDGEILNKGFEFTLSLDVLRSLNWSLNTTLIFSRNRNEVLSLGDHQSAGLLTDFHDLKYEYFGGVLNPFRQTSPNILAIGHPVNVFYGYRTAGIVQSSTQGAEAGLIGVEAEPGEFKFIDYSENGIFDEDDRIIIGDPNPDFMASLNIDFSYKNWECSLFLNGVFGNDVLRSDITNSPQINPLRWTYDNPTNDYPRRRDNRLHYVSDWHIQDGSFVRIQNIHLGYRFDKTPFFNDFKVYLNAENLYTFTKFKGYDPEVELNGRYWGGYPRFSRYTLGLSFTF